LSWHWDPNNGGAFGLALTTSGTLARVAFVDDNQNSLTISTKPVKIWIVPEPTER
jgi:hypothetical protein